MTAQGYSPKVSLLQHSCIFYFSLPFECILCIFNQFPSSLQRSIPWLFQRSSINNLHGNDITPSSYFFVCLFNFLFTGLTVTVHGLSDCWQTHCHCGLWAFHCSGFLQSQRILGCAGFSSFVVQRLNSCGTGVQLFWHCGIFPRPGIKPVCPTSSVVDFHPLYHQGSLS